MAAVLRRLSATHEVRLRLIAGTLAPLAIAGALQAVWALVGHSREALLSLAISLAGAAGAIAWVAVLAGRIERRHHELANLLDSQDRGFLSLHADGTLAAERSAMATQLLGAYRPGQRLWEAIAPHDPTTAAWLDLCWVSLLEDAQPRELALDQLPTKLTIRDRNYRIEYRPSPGAAGDMLVVITDETAGIARDRAEAAERDLLKMVERMTRHRSGFSEMLEEIDREVRLIESLAGEPVSDKLKRELHTLKGNCALVGLTQIAEACHELEDRIAATQTVDPNVLRSLVQSWELLTTKLARVAGPPPAHSEVGQDDLAELREALSRGASLGMIDHIIRSWALERTRPRLERFAEQARSLADRLGKPEVIVGILDHGVRLDPVKLRPFWAALAHVIRNAVDHGIESAAEREAAGKPPHGELQLVTRWEGNTVLIEVSDDGRGVDWESLRGRARATGWPHATRDDLIAAMFRDGISTRSSVSETSGRGVGLAALREACVRLGGTFEVDSEPGRGTRFRFKLPLERQERMTSKMPRLGVGSYPPSQMAPGGALAATPAAPAAATASSRTSAGSPAPPTRGTRT